MPNSFFHSKKTAARKTIVLVQDPQHSVQTRTDYHKHKLRSTKRISDWCQKILPIFSLVNDCSKTKKNNVFDKSDTLQHSTSQVIYSSGCGCTENVSAKPLIVSIFRAVMSSCFKVCTTQISKAGTYIHIYMLGISVHNFIFRPTHF